MLLFEGRFYPKGTSIQRTPPSRRFGSIRKPTLSGDGTLATPAALLGNCHVRALVKLAVNPRSILILLNGNDCRYDTPVPKSSMAMRMPRISRRARSTGHARN